MYCIPGIFLRLQFIYRFLCIIIFGAEVYTTLIYYRYGI